MENAYVVDATIVDKNTIKLKEDLIYMAGDIKVIIMPQKTNKPRKAGLLKGQIHISEDFNAPIEELREYME